MRIVPKGGRKGHEMSWQTLLSGEAELRRDLNLSLDVYQALRRTERPDGRLTIRPSILTKLTCFNAPNAWRFIR